MTNTTLMLVGAHSDIRTSNPRVKVGSICLSQICSVKMDLLITSFTPFSHYLPVHQQLLLLKYPQLNSNMCAIFFFFCWRYNPLWFLAFSVIYFHSALSLHNFLHPSIP